MSRSGIWLRHIALLGLGTMSVMLVLAACAGPEPLKGTELRPTRDATPIELQNQFGKLVSLSDHSGKVVLLTFLYTNCPDVCPIVTSQLREIRELLGRDAEETAIVVVSVDPERDSVPAALDYSDKWGMTQTWDYLVGNEEELSPIWDAYPLAPAIDDHSSGDDTRDNTSFGQAGGVQGLKQAIGERYLVIHSTPVYLIDREGDMRAVFTSPLEPEDLVHDIRVLLD